MTEDPTPNMTAIAASLERITTLLVRWVEEDRQLVADLDHKVGHLRRVVADHEERLTA